MKRFRNLVRADDPESLPSLGVWIETSSCHKDACWVEQSLPSLGVWIETEIPSRLTPHTSGHSLHWECGLKLLKRESVPRQSSHSLHWECGLKLPKEIEILSETSHSLHWECGLKLQDTQTQSDHHASLPSLGVWIETPRQRVVAFIFVVTPFIGSVD